MTEEELKRLEMLAEDATPGEMLEQVDYSRVSIIRDNQYPGDECCRTVAEFPALADETAEQFGRRMSDAVLFVAARNALPSLIAALRAERRRAEVAEARLALSEATIRFAKAVSDCEWYGTNESQEHREKARAAVSETTARLVALGVEP